MTSLSRVKREVEIVRRALGVPNPELVKRAEETNKLIVDYMNSVNNATFREVEEAERYAERLKANPPDDPYVLALADAHARNLRSAYVDRTRRHET